MQRCYDPTTPSFGPALQHTYFRRADVINRGFGGYNTEWLLPVLEQQILPSVFNVVLWIILIGTNDAMLPPGANHVFESLILTRLMFQVPIESFKQNLLKIVDAIKCHHDNFKTKPRIILFSPPPVQEAIIFRYYSHQAHLRAQETTFAYSRVVMDLDVPPCVEKLDLHNAIELASKIPCQAKTNPLQLGNKEMISSLEEFLSDGVHLKNPSYEIMYQLVMEAIDRRWPEITPQNMPMPVTWWGNLINDELQQRDEL